MLAYLTRRIGISLVVLLGLSLLAFFMVRLVPGDTAAAMLGVQYSEDAAAAMRQRYGLDRPMVVQYGLWLGHVARFDFGRSVTGRAVTAEIAAAFPVTLQLMAMSLTLAVLTGIPLGILAAVRRNRVFDHAAGLAGLLGLSVPGFWLGTLLIIVFALWLGALPSGGFVAFTDDPAANLRHMILPAIALGGAVAAVLMRMTRASMIEAISQDYVRTARAKGLSRVKVIGRHALRNALTPVLTIAGIQAGYLLGGSVVIEEVFAINGLGRLVLRAIGDRDYLLLQAVILLIGAAFLMINLLVDVLYACIDPRIRVGAGGES